MHNIRIARHRIHHQTAPVGGGNFPGTTVTHPNLFYRTTEAHFAAQLLKKLH